MLKLNEEMCQKVELHKAGIFLYLHFSEGPLEITFPQPSPPQKKNMYQTPGEILSKTEI